MWRNILNFFKTLFNSFNSNPAVDKLIKKYSGGSWCFTYRFISKRKNDFTTYFRASYTSGCGWYYRDCGLCPEDYISFKDLVESFRCSSYLFRYNNDYNYTDSKPSDSTPELEVPGADWAKVST